MKNEASSKSAFQPACIKVVMRFILVLALEHRDTKPDGVPNVCACSLLQRQLAEVQHRTVPY